MICFQTFSQLGLVWVVKRKSRYPPYPGSNPTCDMFSPCGLIRATKVPFISLFLKVLNARHNFSKYFNPKGLSQLVSTNVVRHLASSLLESVGFESPQVRSTNIH
jgi:hypothetical protein